MEAWCESFISFQSQLSCRLNRRCIQLSMPKKWVYCKKDCIYSGSEVQNTISFDNRIAENMPAVLNQALMFIHAVVLKFFQLRYPLIQAPPNKKVLSQDLLAVLLLNPWPK